MTPKIPPELRERSGRGSARTLWADEMHAATAPWQLLSIPQASAKRQLAPMLALIVQASVLQRREAQAAAVVRSAALRCAAPCLRAALALQEARVSTSP